MLLKKNENKKNNIESLLANMSSLLKAKGIKEANLEARLILSLVLKKDSAYILSHLEENLDEKDLVLLDKMTKDRLKGWSLAVLCGFKDFYKTSLIIDKNVLVPRPATEAMVENIIKEAKKDDFIFDIGTGSGAIIISLALELKSSNYFYASDKSLKALKIAKLNISNHGVLVKLLHGDLLKPYLGVLKRDKPSKVIIAANLPYLTPGQMKESSIKKEPVSALLSGSDGLWHYRRLFSQLRSYLKTSIYNTSFSIYCEINPEQQKNIKNSALRYFPQAKVDFQKDLSGQIRFCLINI